MEFLNPILALGHLNTILIIAFGITLLSSLAYKFLTDQNRMKELKQQQKKHQAKMKKHQKDPEKMMKVQKKAMEANMEYMKASFKPMIFTMLPIFLVFGWMHAHLNYLPINAGEDFTTSAVFAEGFQGDVTIEVTEGVRLVSEATQPIENGIATWTLNGDPGEYILEYTYEDIQVRHTVLIDEYLYKPNVMTINNPKLTELRINNERSYPVQIGSFKVTWLWTYVIVSIIMNLIIRKAMKIN